MDIKDIKMEKEILSLLTSAKVNKVNLKAYSSQMTHLRLNKLALERWWVVGQPPIEEFFHLKARLPKDGWKNLANILNVKGLIMAEVFPIGIINPEGFDIHFQFDSRKM